MPRRPLPIALLLIAVTTSASFGAQDDPSSAAERVREQVLRMTEFFDTTLPGVLGEHNTTLHFRPKFSDFRDYEYIRFPIELRYGLTRNWELQTGFVPFTPNPFNRGRDHRWGLGELTFGAKYDLGRGIRFFDDTTIGLETRFPLGVPPVELNDHYTHVKPYLSAARQIRRWPSTTFYLNLAYDRSVNATDRDPPPPEVVRRDIAEVAPGLLFKPSELGYFAEYRFRHIREPIGWHLAHQVQFGVIWDVPLARSEKWNLPGKWQLELGYKIEHEEGRDSGHGFAARVNWRTTLREVLDHARSHRVLR